MPATTRSMTSTKRKLSEVSNDNDNDNNNNKKIKKDNNGKSMKINYQKD